VTSTPFMTPLAVSGSFGLKRNRPIEMIVHYSGKAVLGAIICVVELSLTIELIQQFGIQWEIEKEIILMTPEQTVQLINVLVRKREESGLSVNEVARRAEVDPGTVWRIEQGMIPTPKADSLKAIGNVLGIPSIDLFAIVGWIPSGELPSLNTYLRAKYGQLPEEAVKDIQSHIEAVMHRYGVQSTDSVTEQRAESHGTVANSGRG
jgi:transcriptional regulator with XRE-family HTH domain